MKNTQQGNWKTIYGKQMTGIKKFKRKGRDPVKHVNAFESLTHEPEMNEDSNRSLLVETSRSKSLERLHDRDTDADHKAPPRRNSNTAIDMSVSSLSSVAGRLASSQSQPSSPASAKDTFRNASPQASYMNNSDEASPRKRLGETSAVVTEIKAIQQTRRLLANARERTRVHTISAAFEALRKQVPCYSYGQKLSKLAILRIACNYILSLAQLAELDYSPDHSNVSFAECVEQCTRTLQAEGRSKKRKE
ncbi:transcription factor atoh8 isoform X2 [Conger conger]|uniref:transcription factor atoh8 isoform X2 n=1 Tax=Conger conger TaxID=82655 RepID=UPI002A5A9B24|nr:transcription factor atoh8 isoform X2 [Conger conger]